MLIAIVLIHDKTNTLNSQQITAIVNNLTVNTETVNGDTRKYYTINGVNLVHEAIFFQVIPQGVTLPSNLYSLNSYKVFYNADQEGNNRRFFNWGLKRAVEKQADVVILIRDVSLLTMADLKDAAEELSGTKILVQRTWGYLVGPKLLKNIGMLVESMSFKEALNQLKARILNTEYIYE